MTTEQASGPPPTDAPLMVRVVSRGTQRGYEGVWIERIAISAFCDCGARRGTPYEHHFAEDGNYLTCDRWENPCGHIDLYGNLLAARHAIVDAHGQQVHLPPEVVATQELKDFMAGRVAAKDCPHYMSATEAACGLTKCERCP